MRLPKYSRYKTTDVNWLGAIPAHWATRQGRRLFEQRRDPARENDEQLSATQKYGVVPQRLFMELEDHKVMLALSGLDNFKHVEPDDFVISLRSFQGGIERSKYAGCVSPAYTVLRAAFEHSPGYWAYLLKSSSYIRALQTMTDGIRDGKTISYAQFGALVVPLPTLEEQHAIATFLDRETSKIDALIAEQEKLLALLAEKRQATISRAVTRGLNPDVPLKDSGISWLDKVPRHWEIVGLTKYIDSIVDYRGRTPTKVDDGVFLVTAKNIRDGVIDYDSSQEYIDPHEYDEVMRRGTPKKGDVLFTTEAPLGQVAIVDREDIALAQRIIKFRANPERLNNAYLKTWIMSRFCQFNLEQLATGSTALGIKGSKIGQVRMCLPPLEEQREIVAFVEEEMAKLDALETTAERAIALLKERRSALITAAVTGKIDVRNTVPEELAA